MGRERPLHFIPRYEVIGNKNAGIRLKEKKVLLKAIVHPFFSFSFLGINSLKIRNVNLDDDGIYQCQIGRTVEARESISNLANITVLVPPSRISLSYLPPGNIVSGREFQVQCEVLNTRPPPIFTWRTPANTNIKDISYKNELMTTNSKLFKSKSIITLIANLNQHGQELKCEVKHLALNETLTSTTVIAVDCKFYFNSSIKAIYLIEKKFFRSTYC